MKKELNIAYKSLNIDFYYDDRSFKPSEVKKLKLWLIRTSKVMQAFLESDLKLKSLKLEVMNLSLSIVGDKKIQGINREHREKDKVTDVLTFPAQMDLRNKKTLDMFNQELELGDILICKNVCSKQAKEFELSFYEEFVHLLIHGFLHICGYDHERSVKEEKLVESLEEKIISKI